MSMPCKLPTVRKWSLLMRKSMRKCLKYSLEQHSLELETKVLFAKISQSCRRALLVLSHLTYY